MSPRCKSCGKEVWWGVTPAGKRMPMDLHPTDDGNVVIDRDKVANERALALIATRDRAHAAEVPALLRILKKADTVHPDEPRYRSHFATCPASKRHRRPARGAA